MTTSRCFQRLSDASIRSHNKRGALSGALLNSTLIRMHIARMLFKIDPGSCSSLSCSFCFTFLRFLSTSFALLSSRWLLLQLSHGERMENRKNYRKSSLKVCFCLKAKIIAFTFSFDKLIYGRCFLVQESLLESTIAMLSLFLSFSPRREHHTESIADSINTIGS